MREGERLAVDLDRIVTVRKQAVVQWTRAAGLLDEDEKRRFRHGCARKFARTAFPDDLAFAVDGLRERVLSKHRKSSAEGRALDLLEDIRATGAPSWSASAIDVCLLCCPPSEEELESFGAAEWERLAQGWLSRCRPHGVITSIDGTVVPLDRLSARDYVDSDPLDLQHLSLAAR